jgi:CHAT domain-containing protein
VPLPGASREAATIARLLPTAAVRTLAGADASEARVRAAVRGARVLHFAAHSVVRDDRPMDSYLALAGSSTAADDDGRLTAQEIHGLDLEASLVVLSACRSAGGKVTGDGIIGLTRAFMSAGAPAVVASVWDLPDETAPRLFEAFYRHRRAVSDTAALRQAQLDVLGALRGGRVTIETRAGSFVLPEHPAIWAGLQLWGTP